MVVNGKIKFRKNFFAAGFFNARCPYRQPDSRQTWVRLDLIGDILLDSRRRILFRCVMLKPFLPMIGK
jgi:hypothetical protein